MPQAILTRYLPATNFNGSRIKASCERGSLTISYPDDKNMGEDAHRAAVEALMAKFVAEDAKQYGSPRETNPWSKPFVSGGLPNGDWAHVFTS